MSIYIFSALHRKISKAEDESVICTKIGCSSHSKELLQTFDVRGRNMNVIVANKQFDKFATIDDAGIVYILEEIK